MYKKIIIINNIYSYWVNYVYKIIKVNNFIY